MIQKEMLTFKKKISFNKNKEKEYWTIKFKNDKFKD